MAGEHTKNRSAFWCVSPRTMQKWIAEKVPVDSVEEMLRWVAALPSRSQSKLTKSFRRRVDELRMELERKTGQPFVSDPDYIAFLAARSGAPAAAESTRLSQLKLQVDFALHQIALANSRRDPALLKDATDTYNRLSGVLHDEELRAQRLNREIGDTIPRAEAERIASAIGYWLVRSADELQSSLAKRIAEASSTPLFREEVRAMIESEVLSSRVLHPLARAAEVKSDSALPRWFIAALRSSVAATIEDGPAHFDRVADPAPAHRAAPPLPSPPPP
jgi:hypothetical protein